MNEMDYLKEKHLQEDAEETIIVFHDNGIPGSEGYTEYKASEIEKMGGIQVLKNHYVENGIRIIEIK